MSEPATEVNEQLSEPTNEGAQATCEGLALVVVQEASEGLGDDPAGGGQGGGRHVGGLQQHCSNQVHALQQLQVDVHVKGHLAPPFQLLLLRRLVLVPARGNRLGRVSLGGGGVGGGDRLVAWGARGGGGGEACV